MTKEEDRQRLIKDLNRFCNDRARLEYAFDLTLKTLGISKQQRKKIIADVRLANFDSLKKTMKIE